MAGNELQPDATAPTGTGPRGDAGVKPGIDYRQLQQTTELREPWHIPSSGAAGEAEELANALKGFSKGANHVADTLNTQAGKAAGSAAGTDTANFQPKTGLAAVTAFGASYNAAAHVSYVANTQTSIETAIDQAEQAYPHDPIAYAAQVQKVRDATLAQTPSLYQPEVQTMFDRRIEAGHNRIAEATIKQSQQDGVASYTGTEETRIKSAVRTAADLPDDKATATIQQALHDNATMADGLVASGAISKTRGDLLKQEFQDKITEEVHTHHAQSVAGNWISSARTTQDITTGDQALASYVNDPKNSNEDKERIGAEYARQREQFEHQQGILHAPEVQALASYIEQIPGEKEGRGAFGPQVLSQIDSARKQGWITTEYARSLSDRAALNAEKGKTDDADTYNVDRVWHGQDPKFDPKDPKAAKAVDTHFQTLAKSNGFAPGTDGYNSLAVSEMQHTSIVPPVVRKQIIGALNAGDPDAAVGAMRLAERMHEANPQADLYQDDAKSAAFASSLRRNIEAGIPNAQAYQMARQQSDAPKDVQEQRKVDYDGAVKTATEKNPHLANSAVLQDKLDDAANAHFWNSNAPAAKAPVAQRAEFEGLVQEFYGRTGDMKQAQDLAFRQVQQTWTQTNVNGKPEIMKYGPTPAEVPIIRAGIAETVKAHGFDMDPSTVNLTPSSRTSLSQGRLWNLTDAHGDLLLDDKHKPIEIDKSFGAPMYNERLKKQKADDTAADLKRQEIVRGIQQDADSTPPSM